MRPERRQRGCGSGFGTCLVGLVLAVPVIAAAQIDAPAARLSATAPALFPVTSVVDATLAGVTGARIVAATEAQRQAGLLEGDLVAAIDGQPLVLGAGAPPAPGPAPTPGSAPTLTVLRFVAGERPVLSPALLGRQTLETFDALPTEQQTPMRLARMLANQQMLVRHGVGVVLVPATANADDAAWLAVANPLPAPWEDALKQVRDAIHDRVDLPHIDTSEAEEAARLLAGGEFVVAEERARRAVFDYLMVPEQRVEVPAFRDLQALHAEATRQLEAARREFLQPGGRFAVVVEPLFSSTSTPLTQDIFFDIDRSNGIQIAAGLNTSLHWPRPDGGWPVFRDLDLLVEYAFAPRRYEGPHGADELPIGAAVEPPVTERVAVNEHRVSFELTYRPTLLSRLRPTLRGGPAFFRSSVRSTDEFGHETMDVSVQSWGWVAGVGVDVYNHRPSGFRAALVGMVQQVEQEFCDDREYPPAGSWESASNLPEYKRNELRPARPTCADGAAFYRLESSAWQAGVTLAYEF